MLLEVSTSKTRIVIIIKSIYFIQSSSQYISKERKVLFRNYTNHVIYMYYTCNTHVICM